MDFVTGILVSAIIVLILYVKGIITFKKKSQDTSQEVFSVIEEHNKLKGKNGK